MSEFKFMILGSQIMSHQRAKHSVSGFVLDAVIEPENASPLQGRLFLHENPIQSNLFP